MVLWSKTQHVQLAFRDEAFVNDKIFIKIIEALSNLLKRGWRNNLPKLNLYASHYFDNKSS